MPVTHRYKAANTARDLPKGSPFRAMDAFLLSDRVQDVASAGAADIAEAAQRLAEAEAYETGEYSRGFEAVEIPPVGEGGPGGTVGGIHLEGGPRRAAIVKNGTPTAAVNEFGNSRREGKHILRRAGEPWDSPQKRSR